MHNCATTVTDPKPDNQSGAEGCLWGYKFAPSLQEPAIPSLKLSWGIL